MRHLRLACALGLALLVAACERQEPETTVVESGVTLDRTSRPGRVFVYLGAGGEVVRTPRYEDIPADRRGTVIVLEGDGRRGRARPQPDGGPRIELGRLELRPGADGGTLRGPEEARLGEEAARKILAAEAAAEAAREDVELKRELEELEKEQAKEPAGEEP